MTEHVQHLLANFLSMGRLRFCPRHSEARTPVFSSSCLPYQQPRPRRHRLWDYITVGMEPSSAHISCKFNNRCVICVWMFRNQPQRIRTAQNRSVMNLSNKLLYYNRFSIRQVNCLYFTSQPKLAATLIVRTVQVPGTQQMSRDRWPFLADPCCFSGSSVYRAFYVLVCFEFLREVY